MIENKSLGSKIFDALNVVFLVIRRWMRKWKRLPDSLELRSF